MDEFAMGSTCENSYFGGAKNPHNPAMWRRQLRRSTSAVGGDLAVYGVGSDTGAAYASPRASAASSA
jgi:aspartyl-tRNA(Asn)/glutamyl-tRNA(Gln) amidotransferase subunit A